MSSSFEWGEVIRRVPLPFFFIFFVCANLPSGAGVTWHPRVRAFRTLRFTCAGMADCRRLSRTVDRAVLFFSVFFFSSLFGWPGLLASNARARPWFYCVWCVSPLLGSFSASFTMLTDHVKNKMAEQSVELIEYDSSADS